jgi:hypothetical protein
MGIDGMELMQQVEHMCKSNVQRIDVKAMLRLKDVRKI